jgi:hypothetical protein
MRGFRSTLVLLVVFLGLLGYIYFVESKKPQGPDSAPPKEKAFSVEADKIAELNLKAESGQQTVLSKSDGTWRLLQPTAATADQSEMSAITSGLSSLEIQRVVDDNPSDLKQYGLAEPRIEVGFKKAGDKDFTRLSLGDKTATGGDLYAKLANEKKVFLVSGFLDSTFNRTPFDLRDKAILKFDRDKADVVELVTPDHAAFLSKGGENWTLTKPVAARGDFGAVEGLIGRLQTAQMKSIAAADAGDPKTYGLDKPEVTATVGTGSQRATIEVGKKTAEGTYYARDTSRPMVFTVEAALVDELKKPADEFRRKDVFEFRAFNASYLEFSRGADTVAFEKGKGQGKDAQEKWRLVKPTARDVDATKMDTLLTKLSSLRAQSFAAPAVKTGIEKPSATAFVRYDDGKKEERVSFSRTTTDVYAARAGDPGAAKIDGIEFEDVLKALDALK